MANRADENNWSYVKCSGFLEQLPNLKNGNETDERVSQCFELDIHPYGRCIMTKYFLVIAHFCELIMKFLDFNRIAHQRKFAMLFLDYRKRYISLCVKFSVI